MSYPEALRWLAKKYHIEIKERELSNEEKEAQSARESMFVINEFARDYFQNILYNHIDGKSIGMTYFRQRGIRDDIVKKFQLGYSTSAKDGLAQEAIRKGYKKEYLIKTGLCYEKEDGSIRDRFWGRVIFPWFNISGKILGFGGRVLDNRTKGVSQKYVNSPESEIYSTRKELYGICTPEKKWVFSRFSFAWAWGYQMLEWEDGGDTVRTYHVKPAYRYVAENGIFETPYTVSSAIEMIGKK